MCLFVIAIALVNNIMYQDNDCLWNNTHTHKHNTE